MMIGIIRRYANRRLRRQVDALTAELEAARREIKVLEAESESLAAVIARDRERIRAEGACYIRQRVEAEGRPTDERAE